MNGNKMNSFKNLPKNEKPRERALTYGIDKLSNIELLSIILNTGSKHLSVDQLASSVLSLVNDIQDLRFITYQELTSLEGISEHKALLIMAILELQKRIDTSISRNKVINSKMIIEYFMKTYKNVTSEICYLVLLDKKDQILFIKELFKGNEGALVFSSSIVLNYIYQYGAKRFILIHNHPSGDPTPSKRDNDTTNSLQLICYTIDIEFVDHLIFSKDSFFSIMKQKKFSYQKIEDFNL